MKKPKSKVMRGIMRTIIIAVVGVVCGLCIYNWNANNIAGNKMPMPFGIGVSVVLSGSMSPEINVNDVIIVKQTDEFFEEQVVVFQKDNALVVHRIISIEGDVVVTQGDANNTADKPITKADIKGEVVCVIPAVGVALSFLKNPIVLLGIVVLALYLLERSFRQEKDDNQDEIEQIKQEIKTLSEQIDKKEDK